MHSSAQLSANTSTLPPKYSLPTPPLALQSYANIKRWPRDQDIVYQDEWAEDLYCVISGAARQCIVRPDGRRQIVDILLPGDFFGFTPSSTHRFAVQAVVEDTIVASYSRRRIEEMADNDPQVAREFRQRLYMTISRLQEHLLVVGTMRAPEKVRAFLAHLSERIPDLRNDGMVLPVSRYDIADQLGLSVETVCRAMTELKTSGAIHLGGPRKVQITAQH
ncbi:MAG: FixK family transcriptional regulator [Devosia sp.]|uniref:cyclic nucleotide-binding domain-containing protein n=1 Tax=Devosia sp. TaxID=1871048 RepID=UPI0026363D2F|nr:cyclic nucleotide-binding domain-containing protein [Devosia sp.]MDB5542521.1 FixK family transcriptional regulator [Devosia sp.]